MDGKERVDYFIKVKSPKDHDILYIFVSSGASVIILLEVSSVFIIHAPIYPFYHIEGLETFTHVFPEPNMVLGTCCNLNV